MKKKVLIINNSSVVSGAEMSLITLLDSLNCRYSFTIFIPGKGALHSRLIASGYDVKCIKMARFHKKAPHFRNLLYFANLLVSAIRISSYAIKNHIGIIYANSNQSMLYTVFIRFFTRIKVIWHVRDRVEHYWEAKLLSWNASTIICVSKYIFEQIPVTVEKKRLIYNGLDTQKWMPAVAKQVTLKQDTDLLFVGQIGQLLPWKNHIDFINVAELTIRSFKKIHFFIIGNDLFSENIQYINMLKELIKYKNLENYITFTGYSDDMIATINKLDVVMHCAINEPFGRVIVEAMAMEKPIIAYHSGGISEIVTHQKTGLLSPLRDYSDLSDNLLLLLKDNELRRRLGIEGRKEVIKKFSSHTTSLKIQAVLDS